MTRRWRATGGKWFVFLAVAVFVANLCYFLALMRIGSPQSNPPSDRIIPMHNHGTTFFVTNAQHDLWSGSLIVAAVLFMAGALLFEKNRQR